MRAPPPEVRSPGHVVQIVALARASLGTLAGAPTHPHRAPAARRLRRQMVWLVGTGAALVVVLMFGFDATEIGLMPPRGTPSLWPARVLTDFGRDEYVVAALAVILVVILVALLRAEGKARASLLRLGTHVEYLLLAVSVPLLIAEVLKWVVGRGRPFVGGRGHVLNFSPFHGTEAYFSFPSAHAVTAFALGFGVAAIWPRARLPIAAYVLVIAMTRLVLLAHHPSDVVAGAVIGIAGAMAVRYWFAARRLGFAILRDGEIVAR